MKIYYAYKSDQKDKKYYIITITGNRVYCGSSGYEDHTTHKDPKRKKHIGIEMKKMKIGPHPVLILLVFGLCIIYGHNLQKKKACENIKKIYLKKNI